MLSRSSPRPCNAPLGAAPASARSGRVRAIEARQLLRAAQVGGLPDARLELNAYDPARAAALGVGPWIGEEHRPRPRGHAGAERSSFDAARAAPGAARFDAALPPERSPAFSSSAARVRGAGRRRRARWPGAPGVRAAADARRRTMACALLRAARGGEVLFGVDDDDLPAAQLFTGNSNLLVAPAWRIPPKRTT